MRLSAKSVACILLALSLRATGTQAGEPIDLADPAHRHVWLSHPAVGDVSYDNFTRSAHNPIHVGRPPYEWPVNCFLFRDEPSGDLYAHVSLYPKGYWPAGPSCLYRSHDRGTTWEDLGIVLKGDQDSFDSDGSKPGATLDVTVARDKDGYHLAYGWAKPDNSDGGIAYAFSKSPAGPFTRAPEPIHAESHQPLIPPGYKRVYASTIIKRKKDWLILASMSTPRNAGGMWAFVGMTAPQARGPYTPPTFLRAPHRGEYFPQPVEFCPAFTHGEYVYANLTSIAANRGYQLLLRAKIEEAHAPEGWSIFQTGSNFHAEPIRSEAMGIWGQAFSGRPDGDRLLALYPSRNADGIGTINLASRPWDTPFRPGFWLSGPNAPALGLVLREYDTFRLDADITAIGNYRLIWSHRAPLGPDRSTADAAPSPLSLADLTSLSITDSTWRLEAVKADGARQLHSEGRFDAAKPRRQFEVHQHKDRLTIHADGRQLLELNLPARAGSLGLIAEKGAYLNIHRFTLDSTGRPRSFFLLALEGTIGAGHIEPLWTRASEGFRLGTGYTGDFEHARAKWNFSGRSVRLWSPRGPDFGEATVLLDGKAMADPSLHSDSPQPSTVIWSAENLPPGLHAVMLVRKAGTLPVDCVEFKP